MNDFAQRRFRFSLANLLLAMVPVAVMVGLSEHFVRTGAWYACIPLGVLGLPSAIGALKSGRAGMWRGFLGGFIAIALTYWALFVPATLLIVLRAFWRSW
jgi:hypothetical protein